MSFTGWTIPIEPLLSTLRTSGSFQKLSGDLATRAR
jgi:hypothetical protein